MVVRVDGNMFCPSSRGYVEYEPPVSPVNRLTTQPSSRHFAQSPFRLLDFCVQQLGGFVIIVWRDQWQRPRRNRGCTQQVFEAFAERK